ncbi:thioredoxin-disulfide reductase [candidate division KSB1 bacterium]|nr:thioredoxin-disulfide reductase [candidate division KSB1 bacterium]
MENVIIIGGGPAGYTAAIYTARSLLKPLVFTGETPGGQITLTNDLENYPGFPEGISGIEFFQKVDQQAKKFGARIENKFVTAVDLSSQPFKVSVGKNEYESRALIVATGSSPRKLEIPGEKEFTGKGVSFCATCDGFFFREKHVAVIGGGNSALDEGLYLTRFASKVSIIHRRNQLRADQILQDRARRNGKIEFILDTVVEEILGSDTVDGLRMKNVQTGKTENLPIDGVFVFIGYIPNSQIFDGQLEMTDAGYIKANSRMHTSVEGVFVAGDIHDELYRQVSTSCGSGTIAAIEAEKFVAEMEGRAYPGK